MDTQKLVLIFIISLGSLAWGSNDLIRKKDKGAAFRLQSYAQVVAGVVGLLVGMYYLLK